MAAADVHLARKDIDDELRGNESAALVRNIEAALKRQSRYVTRVDVVPIVDRGGA